MPKENHFLISFIVNNDPKSIEVVSETEALPIDLAENFIRDSLHQTDANITDIQVISLHRATNPDVQPGHYQQPEG